MDEIHTLQVGSDSAYERDAAPMERYMPYYSWICCTSYKDRSKFQNLLENIDLTPVQKQIIKTRYLNILENFQKRARNYGIVFFIGHSVITIGSLFVPALLSIQKSEDIVRYNSDVGAHLYWVAFIFSVLVTIFNGIITLFKIDKKYYFLNTTLERLRTEGWQYFSLTGHYAGSLLNTKKNMKHKKHRITPTHRNQFIYFTHYIENIKMKQVEEEYYKTDELAALTPTQSDAASTTIPCDSTLSKTESVRQASLESTATFSPPPELVRLDRADSFADSSVNTCSRDASPSDVRLIITPTFVQPRDIGSSVNVCTPPVLS
jgi:hypothetical protein